MAKPLEYNASLTLRDDLTDSLAVFKVRPDQPWTAEPLFVPGQYVVLGLNNEDRPELGSVLRPMSIVSAPGEGSELEFYIRYVHHPESDNPLTHLLWHLSSGDRMYMGPKIKGHFTLAHTLPEGDRRLKVCVAAGTGLAPFVSMVRQEVADDPAADLSSYIILHGASYPADLGYKDEMEGLAASHGLRYRATVSRPREAPDWDGDAGRVEDYFQADRLAETESSLGLEPGALAPERATVFICGLQGTIGQTILRLNHRGFVPENRKLRKALEIPAEVPASLFFEQYDTTPVIDLDDPELMATLRRQLADAGVH